MLIAAHQRGATLVGLCLGALPLVDAGLLRGRSAVTHWHAFDLLRHRHPEIPLDDSVLYIDHGDVLTSAGTASGLDADRKSTRLNSSHVAISYAVFCLKKKRIRRSEDQPRRRQRNIHIY